MWTINIRDKGIKDEAITVQVEFTQGEESIVRNFAGNTKEEIDRRIKKQLEALEERDANVELINVGAWTTPTEEEPIKTQEEIDREAWVKEWNKYTKAKAGIDALSEAGITPTAEELAAFESLKAWVADNRKIGYEQYI